MALVETRGVPILEKIERFSSRKLAIAVVIAFIWLGSGAAFNLLDETRNPDVSEQIFDAGLITAAVVSVGTIAASRITSRIRRNRS